MFWKIVSGCFNDVLQIDCLKICYTRVGHSRLLVVIDNFIEYTGAVTCQPMGPQHKHQILNVVSRGLSDIYPVDFAIVCWNSIQCVSNFRDRQTISSHSNVLHHCSSRARKKLFATNYQLVPTEGWTITIYLLIECWHQVITNTSEQQSRRPCSWPGDMCSSRYQLITQICKTLIWFASRNCYWTN